MGTEGWSLLVRDQPKSQYLLQRMRFCLSGSSVGQREFPSATLTTRPHPVLSWPARKRAYPETLTHVPRKAKPWHQHRKNGFCRARIATGRGKSGSSAFGSARTALETHLNKRVALVASPVPWREHSTRQRRARHSSRRGQKAVSRNLMRVPGCSVVPARPVTRGRRLINRCT